MPWHLILAAGVAVSLAALALAAAGLCVFAIILRGWCDEDST